MTPKYKIRANVGSAVLVGLALRLFLVLKFPVTDTGDAPFYIELAWNWLRNRGYGLALQCGSITYFLCRPKSSFACFVVTL
jgi:hypothetical protein